MAYTSPFPYKPLDANDPHAFRLLTILPDLEAAPVKCELENVSWVDEQCLPMPERSSQSRQDITRETQKSTALSRRRSKISWRENEQGSASSLPKVAVKHDDTYEALSYAWGSEDFKLQIFIGGYTFDVTPTLEHALRRLRHLDRLRKVWIDAICINQMDVGEKATQIKQMHHIFANAVRVIVWLGESSRDSDVGIAFAKELSKLFLDEGIIFRNMYEISTAASLKRLIAPHCTPHWSALHRLLNRSWWLRAWIVQEVILAKSVLFLCGGTVISWDEIGQAILAASASYEQYARLEGLYPSDSPEDYFISQGVKCEAATTLIITRERHIKHGSLPCASDWLFINRLRLCEFPHDKIYCILGLTSDAFRKTISVDYGKPIEHLLISVARSIIEQSQSLNVLCHSQHSIWKAGLPSWVPDWRLTERYTRIRYSGTRRPWQPRTAFSGKFSELTVTGVKLDAVVRTHLETELLPGLRRGKGKFGEVAATTIFQPMPDSRCHWWIPQNTLEDLFIPATSRWSLRDIFDGRSANILNIFLKMLSIRKHPESFDREWYTKTALPPNGGNIQHPESLDFADFQVELEDRLASRTIIETEHFLGVASDFTEPGDLIYLISGCTPPVVLRPCGGQRYNFIGDVFLDSQEPGTDRLCSDDFPMSELQDIVLV